MTYTARDALYIGIDEEALSKFQESGYIKLPMTGQVVVLELCEFENGEEEEEPRPGVA